MEIVILNGSPRKDGATGKILNSIRKELNSMENVKVKFVHIVDLNILQCKGCGICYKNGQCFIKDDAEKLSKVISEADGIIIGSPTYVSNISGLLKTFIDRGHFVIEQLLYNKYAISISTYENYGGNKTSKILKDLIVYSGATLSGSINVKQDFNKDPINKKISSKIQRVSKDLYKDISNKRQHFFQRIFRLIIFNVGIKPFVKKKGEEYKGVLNKWSRIGI